MNPSYKQQYTTRVVIGLIFKHAQLLFWKHYISLKYWPKLALQDLLLNSHQKNNNCIIHVEEVGLCWMCFYVGVMQWSPLANSMFHTCSLHSTRPINLCSNGRHLENLAHSLSMKSRAPSLTAHNTRQVVFIVHGVFLSLLRFPISSHMSLFHGHFQPKPGRCCHSYTSLLSACSGNTACNTLQVPEMIFCAIKLDQINVMCYLIFPLFCTNKRGVSLMCEDMLMVQWWGQRAHHQQFSLELLSTKEIVLMTTVDSKVCLLSRVIGTLFWKTILLLNFSNNKIPFSSIVLG